MDFTRPTTLDDHIILLLKTGPLPAKKLLEKLQKITPSTKQGMYYSIRNLRKREAVILKNGVVSLNAAWIKRMSAFLQDIERSYTVEGSSNITSLSEGESISYIFTTSKHLDVFWGHSQTLIVQNTDPSEPMFAYDPHYWFYIARKNSETKLLEDLVRNKRQFLMVAGDTKPLDLLIKTNFNSNYLQYHCEKLFKSSNYYVNVHEDFITEVFLDNKVSAKIDQLYKAETKISDKLISDFEELLNSKGRFKIKISRNKKKAEQLKKMFRKYFYILKPKSEAEAD